MHGTVEWLPGSPLGNTDTSWPDQLLGDIPNLYVYAANNPSESLLSKRRGYSTLVSYNVPPYARAGLYKDLINIKELTSEYRTDRSPSAIPLIAAILERTDLYKDIPYKQVNSTILSADLGDMFPADGVLTSSMAEDLLNSPKSSAFMELFDEYCGRLTDYLNELENRIFSQGLHVIGDNVSAKNVFGYLQAVFSGQPQGEVVSGTSDALSDFVLYAIATGATQRFSTAEIRYKARLAEALGSAGGFGLNETEKLSFDQIDTQWKRLSQTSVEWKPHSNIDFLELLDDDSKIMLQLIQHKSVRAALRYSYLSFRSNWGSKAADEEMHVIKQVGMDGLDNEGRLRVTLSSAALDAAINLAETLVRYSNEEMNSLLRGLNGEYIAAAPGGDLIRDGKQCLYMYIQFYMILKVYLFFPLDEIFTLLIHSEYPRQ